MNEKIEKLWRQVKLEQCDCGCNSDEYLRFQFAELIVMECADWVKSRTMSNELKQELKRHFGVK
jgi:hypothetical protein